MGGLTLATDFDLGSYIAVNAEDRNGDRRYDRKTGGRRGAANRPAVKKMK